MEKYRHGGNVWQGKDPFKWLDFSANINPDGTPEEMLYEIKKSLQEITLYPDASMGETTEKISKFLGLPPEMILPTNGGIGALSLIMWKEKPGKAVILQPAFVEYERLSVNADCEIVHINLMGEAGITYDEEKIIENFSVDAVLFICNPSNPTGSMMGRAMLERILKEAKARKTIVVLDEAFIEYCDEKSSRALVKEWDNLIITGSLTKMFAIPGIRLGYILASPSRINAYREFQTPWSISSHGVAAARALPGLRKFVRESSEKNSANREILSKELSNLGFTVFPSEGSYVLVKIDTKIISHEALIDMLKAEGILIRDCSNYRGLGKGYFRIAVKSREDNERLVKVMGRILASR